MGNIDQNVGSIRKNMQKAGAGLKGYAMFIALALIFVLFAIFTGGTFLSPRNLTNLVNQTGYVAVMAVAMTMVLIIREIDLAIGYIAGFLGAVAAILLSSFNMPLWLLIPVILILGMVIGTVEVAIINKLCVPAFVATLAFQFVFRGLLSLITSKSGTIAISHDAFNAISNGYIPGIGEVFGMDLLSLLVGAAAILLVITFKVWERIRQTRYGFETESVMSFWVKLILVTALIGNFAVVFARYRGIPWTVVIVLCVTAVYCFILNKTRLGRYIYGVGGNPEAATLAGIRVNGVRMFVFATMGMMCALGGLMYASRLQSASTTAGAGFELDAIAACYIGGVSASGGKGKITNAITGALVIISLTNGLNLMGIGIAYQYVIKGVIFIIAVAFDVVSRRHEGRV